MSIEEMLKALQAEYLSSIPEKIKSIGGFVAQNDGSNLREAFHKLKGTGRTYGIPEVSDLGDMVEKICLQDLKMAVPAARTALLMLGDIYRARKGEITYDFNADRRLEELRKLLQK
jgi:HPt (histidine-containing phosphotransfer) domain-containing protein